MANSTHLKNRDSSNTALPRAGDLSALYLRLNRSQGANILDRDRKFQKLVENRVKIRIKKESDGTENIPSRE
jgi:hypothetical protein